jgi:hypothetical protein
MNSSAFPIQYEIWVGLAVFCFALIFNANVSVNIMVFSIEKLIHSTKKNPTPKYAEFDRTLNGECTI